MAALQRGAALGTRRLPRRAHLLRQGLGAEVLAAGGDGLPLLARGAAPAAASPAPTSCPTPQPLQVTPGGHTTPAPIGPGDATWRGVAAARRSVAERGGSQPHINQCILIVLWRNLTVIFQKDRTHFVLFQFSIKENRGNEISLFAFDITSVTFFLVYVPVWSMYL